VLDSESSWLEDQIESYEMPDVEFVEEAVSRTTTTFSSLLN
jgi:hypothetical protein